MKTRWLEVIVAGGLWGVGGAQEAGLGERGQLGGRVLELESRVADLEERLEELLEIGEGAQGWCGGGGVGRAYPDEYEGGSVENSWKDGVELLYEGVYDSPTQYHLITSLYGLELGGVGRREGGVNWAGCTLVALSGSMPGGWMEVDGSSRPGEARRCEGGGGRGRGRGAK